MSVGKHVIHAIFTCRDCGASWENYLTAQRLASAHAKAKQHTIGGEVGVSVVYDGKVPR